ncbi:hypothetical protein A3Q56_05877 [Intoshia linei]|uniref:PHD-type domain-containing protein n=1 Tax=Intoshia linei TaxID=1819745 RepID=A0A177AWN5_9BILA|nr:hypothetical protein A3Q56_05877 [Intoshia linei]
MPAKPHTSCLKFNTSMKAQILTYPWQCIECKTCWVCKLSDNDEKMLFCDGCDRGYHMYCLNPPMENPPDEKWICLLCYKNQSNMNFNFNVGDN